MKAVFLITFMLLLFLAATAQQEIKHYSSINIGAARKGYTAGFGFANMFIYRLDDNNELLASLSADFFIQKGPPLSKEVVSILGVAGIRFIPAIKAGYRFTPTNSNFFFDAEPGAAFFQSNTLNRVRFIYDGGIGYLAGRNHKFGISVKYYGLISTDNFHWIGCSMIFPLF